MCLFVVCLTPMVAFSVGFWYRVNRHVWDQKFSLRCVFCGNQTSVKARIQNMVHEMQEQMGSLGPLDRYFTVRRAACMCVRVYGGWGCWVLAFNGTHRSTHAV